MAVVEAVRRDLSVLPEAVRNSGLAEIALGIAAKMDEHRTSARDYAALSRELRLVLAQLGEHGDFSPRDEESAKLLARLGEPL